MRKISLKSKYQRMCRHRATQHFPLDVSLQHEVHAVRVVKVDSRVDSTGEGVSNDGSILGSGASVSGARCVKSFHEDDIN